MNNNCQISFGSKIVFVSPSKFENMFNKHINKLNEVTTPWTINSGKTSDNWLGTYGINTCVGGVLGSNDKGTMQHFRVLKDNFENIDLIEYLVNAFNTIFPVKTAVLIGSKPKNVPVGSIDYLIKENHIMSKAYEPDSEKFMEAMKKIYAKFNPSVFEGHNLPNAGSSMLYNVKNDTTYICSFIDVLKNKYVKNAEDLKKVFKNIQISDRDTVHFEN